jgi:hypothetical protein
MIVWDNQQQSAAQYVRIVKTYRGRWHDSSDAEALSQLHRDGGLHSLVHHNLKETSARHCSCQSSRSHHRLTHSIRHVRGNL